MSSPIAARPTGWQLTCSTPIQFSSWNASQNPPPGLVRQPRSIPVPPGCSQPLNARQVGEPLARGCSNLPVSRPHPEQVPATGEPLLALRNYKSLGQLRTPQRQIAADEGLNRRFTLAIRLARRSVQFAPSIIPRHSPRPIRRRPGRSHHPRKMTSSPSPKKVRCSPLGSVRGVR
jgi:hypothetical protein